MNVNCLCITAGSIRVYVEHTIKPIIEFKDSNPLNIKYFGFSTLDQAVVRFFYNCRGDEVYTTSQLQSQCQQLNTTNSAYTQFHRIQDNSITDSDQYPIELPLYVAAEQNAHLLLASDDTYNDTRNGYEIGQ